MFTENTTRKQITGLTLARKDGEKLSSTDEMIPQHGRQYVASGMESSKTMVEADVVLWSKGSTGKAG